MEATAPTVAELLDQAEQAWAHIDIVKYTFNRVVYKNGTRGFKAESETTEAKVYFDLPDSASELRMLIETDGLFDSRYVYHDRVVEVEDDLGESSIRGDDGKVAYYVDDYGPNDMIWPDFEKTYAEEGSIAEHVGTTQVYKTDFLRIVAVGIQHADGAETTIEEVDALAAGLDALSDKEDSTNRRDFEIIPVRGSYVTGIAGQSAHPLVQEDDFLRDPSGRFAGKEPLPAYQAWKNGAPFNSKLKLYRCHDYDEASGEYEYDPELVKDLLNILAEKKIIADPDAVVCEWGREEYSLDELTDQLRAPQPDLSEMFVEVRCNVPHSPFYDYGPSGWPSGSVWNQLQARFDVEIEIWYFPTALSELVNDEGELIFPAIDLYNF